MTPREPMAEGGEVLERRTLVETPRLRFERRTERLPNGRVSDRDVIVHPGAAVILPIRDDGRVVLIDQYRSTVGRRLIELPAGTLEPGEDPAETARRELAEETGYRASKIEFLFTFYPAPGFSDEKMHAYLATGLSPGDTSLDPTECLDVFDWSIAEFDRAIADRRIEDGKTLITYLSWKRRSGP